MNNVNNKDATSIFAVHQFVLICILTFALIGNGSLILMLIREKQKQRKLIDTLTVHLAVMDLILVVSSIPEMLITEAFSTFKFGWFGCKTIHPTSTLAATSNVLTLLVIGYERYRASETQTFVIRRHSNRTIFIVMIDLLSCIVVLPYVLTLTYIDDGGTSPVTCIESWGMSSRKTYTLFLFLVQYGIPALLMIGFYYISWKNIRYSTFQLISHSITGRFFVMRLDKGLGYLKTMSQRYRKEDIRKEPQGKALLKRYLQCKKMTKKFTIILLVFLIFSLPNQMLWLYIDFFTEGDVLFDENIINISYMLTFANCVLNPLIYGRRRRKYDKTMIKGKRKYDKTRRGAVKWI